jgi:hypothetical protein
MKHDLVLRILDKSHELISSARLENARVYNLEDELLGTLHSIMLNKRTGSVAYAVMLLDQPSGALTAAHPLPWRMLSYDEKKSGYVINLSRGVLEQAPSFTLDETDRPREVSKSELDAYYSYDGAPEGSLATPIEEGDFNAQTV